MNGLDLRDYVLIRPLTVERYPAPQLSDTLWPHLVDTDAPRAMGRASESAGWGHPVTNVVPDYDVTGSVAPMASSMGVTGPAAFGAELPSMADLSEWWANLAADLHRAVYRRASQAVTGVQVPHEASSPTAARDYLADLLDRQAALQHWPAEAGDRAEAIRTMAPAATVVGTVDRAVALGGPPREWLGADGWYTVAGQLQQSAGLVSAGEAAGLLQRVPTRIADGARSYVREVRPTIERGLDVASELNRTVGTGIGLGAGLGGAAIVAGGMLVAGAAAAWFFSPELAAGARAVYLAKSAKDSRRKA